MVRPEKEKRGRGRPLKGKTFDDSMTIILFSEQKERIQRAAELSLERGGTGSVSDWARRILVKAAERELKSNEQ
jgi:hypothetical protein